MHLNWGEAHDEVSTLGWSQRAGIHLPGLGARAEAPADARRLLQRRRNPRRPSFAGRPLRGHRNLARRLEREPFSPRLMALSRHWRRSARAAHQLGTRQRARLVARRPLDSLLIRPTASVTSRR